MCQPGFGFAYEIGQGFCRHCHCHEFSVLGHATQDSNDLLGLALNDESTAGTGANGLAIGRAVAKSQEAAGCFALKGSMKLQEAADWADGFLGVSIDVHLLPKLQVIEAEWNPVIVGQRVAQFVDGDVPSRIVFHWIRRGAVVVCGSIIVGPGSHVAVNDPVALNLADLGHHGDVIVGSYKAAVFS